MYRKILVPLDGSELAEQVLPHAKMLARCSGGELILMRVPIEPSFDYLVLEPEVKTILNSEAGEISKSYLEEIAAKLRAEGLKVSWVVPDGECIHEGIEYVANVFNVDLIAMSTHGRGGLARLLMGSVTDQVLRRSRVPVMLIHPEAVSSIHAKLEEEPSEVPEKVSVP